MTVVPVHNLPGSHIIEFKPPIRGTAVCEHHRRVLLFEQMKCLLVDGSVPKILKVSILGHLTQCILHSFDGLVVGGHPISDQSERAHLFLVDVNDWLHFHSCQ